MGIELSDYVKWHPLTKTTSWGPRSRVIYRPHKGDTYLCQGLDSRSWIVDPARYKDEQMSAQAAIQLSSLAAILSCRGATDPKFVARKLDRILKDPQKWARGLEMMPLRKMFDPKTKPSAINGQLWGSGCGRFVFWQEEKNSWRCYTPESWQLITLARSEIPVVFWTRDYMKEIYEDHMKILTDLGHFSTRAELIIAVQDLEKKGMFDL